MSPLPDLDVVFSVLDGVAATVTPPGGVAIPTTVIEDRRTASYPEGGELQTAERRTIISLRRDEVPSIPTGTVIVIGAKTWRVDAIVEEDLQIVKVSVVLVS